MHVRDFSQERLALPLATNRVRTIQLVPGSVVTGQGRATVRRDTTGNWVRDGQDIVKIAVVERHRGTGIAFDTTGTLAGTQVATELLSEDVGRDEYLADLQDRGKFLVHIKLSKFPLRGLDINFKRPRIKQIKRIIFYDHEFL